MRIYIIHNFYQHPGGEDVVFHQQVRELSKQHDVEVFNTHNLKGTKGLLQFISYPFNLYISQKITKAVKRFRPDIVHIHNIHYSIGPQIIRSLDSIGIPIVMTLHNYRLLCPSASLFFERKVFKSSLQERFPRTAIKKKVLDNSLIKTFITGFTYWLHSRIGTWDKVSRFLVLSSFAKEIFNESTFPVPQERFVVHANALEVGKKEAKREDYFVYIGRLSEEKGIIPLIEAFRELPVKLKIYGSGPQEKEVIKIAASSSNIELLGFQAPDTLSASLSTASALIVPSICYEGMPMSIIEAFGNGTPVLASAIGILNKMVLPLYTGLHFDPQHKESIKQCILQWRDISETEKNKIGNNCRKEYEDNYTLQHNLNNLLKIYREVLQEKKGKR
ncbi:glycosyltransferase family 4 protein [Sphingobacterium sp. UT-1RO-CII-1]|uniref:glycosyltransferase family 4 protein n=1 Tax=Sphingobacterium sp. UT-1RO-CII-1 TaxID=2995225 RepID=UPI00227B20AF|nr:glycosyltransferase family 4 protein [Sphingobacterium sp. UT-1RO-CII-1]MCY4781580.1 glycosyltransferase family 4 protein [Sphingobacterium sp. UT-1RO-CII-1]